MEQAHRLAPALRSLRPRFVIGVELSHTDADDMARNEHAGSRQKDQAGRHVRVVIVHDQLEYIFATLVRLAQAADQAVTDSNLTAVRR